MTQCNEIISPSATMDDRGFIQYTRTFQVIFPDRTTSNPNDALLALPITKFDAYSYAGITDATSRATTVTATPENDGVTYTVTVNYTTPESIGRSEEQRPTVSWSYNAYTDVLITDLDNSPIANSAGDKFPEGIEAQRFIPVLTIQRAEPYFYPLQAFAYMGSINVSDFYGAPKGTVRCTDFSGQLAYNQDGSSYYNVTYAFEFGFFPHGKGWDSIVLDEGYNHIDTTVGTGEKAKRRITVGGVPVNDPAKLDGQGHTLPDAGVGYFLQFRVYPYADFSSLNLE